MSIVAGAGLRLDGARSTRPVEVALVVGGSWFLVGMLAMVVLSYRAGAVAGCPRQD